MWVLTRAERSHSRVERQRWSRSVPGDQPSKSAMRITAWTPVLSLLQNLPVSSIESRLTMITSFTEKLASYPVKTTAAQNEHNGDLEISSPCAAPGAANMNLPESVGFSRGQQSLDHSVWYNGALMTFLATGEDTHGQFALIEAVGRKGSDAPPHIHHREDEIFYVLEGEIIVSVGDHTMKGCASPKRRTPAE